MYKKNLAFMSIKKSIFVLWDEDSSFLFKFSELCYVYRILDYFSAFLTFILPCRYRYQYFVCTLGLKISFHSDCQQIVTFLKAYLRYRKSGHIALYIVFVLKPLDSHSKDDRKYFMIVFFQKYFKFYVSDHCTLELCTGRWFFKLPKFVAAFWSYLSVWSTYVSDETLAVGKLFGAMEVRR